MLFYSPIISFQFYFLLPDVYSTLLIGNVTADPSPSNAVSEETDSHSPQHNIEETKHLFESRFESIYDSSTFTRFNTISINII